MSAVMALREGPVAVGRDRCALDRIMQSNVHLAIWHRTAGIVLDGLDWTAIDDIDEDVRVDALVSGVPDLIVAAGYPDGAALAREIVPIAAYFAALMACDALRIRLEVIETDACRKFHADQVTVRLLMPLVGPGTQWMRAGADPQAPEGRLQVGDVGLFKGRVWAEDPVILHRSPPVATTGITRLLLAIDPLGEGHGGAPSV